MDEDGDRVGPALGGEHGHRQPSPLLLADLQIIVGGNQLLVCVPQATNRLDHVPELGVPLEDVLLCLGLQVGVQQGDHRVQGLQVALGQSAELSGAHCQVPGRGGGWPGPG